MQEVEVPARFLSLVQHANADSLIRVQEAMLKRSKGGGTLEEAAGEAVQAGFSQEFGQWLIDKISYKGEPVKLVSRVERPKTKKIVPAIVLAICLLLLAGKLLGVTAGGPAAGIASLIGAPENYSAEFATVADSESAGAVRMGAFANLAIAAFVLFGGAWAMLKLRR